MSHSADLRPTAPCSAELIVDLPELEDLARSCLAAPLIAIDTESDSLYSYTEKICLVQISLPNADYIVDPLTIFSLEPLADVFSNPSVEKIFHGADYDLVSLKRGYGFHFSNIFDTMIAARILGRKNTGLAALVAEHLGLQMDKTMQRSDWGKRPLSPEQLAYACHDTRYLFSLRETLLGELRQAGREQEAREAFADLSNLEPRPRIFDPDAFWNMKGVRDLDGAGQRIAKSLYRWREEQARWEDRPTFKVMNDKTIVALGQEQPLTMDSLRRGHILSTYQITRYGHQVVDIIVLARRSGDRLQPPRGQSGHIRPDDLTLSIYERLRSWRKERAAARGVESDVIISNDALLRLASRRPRSVEDLDAVTGLGPWRRNEYGPEILSVIGSVLAAESRSRHR